MIYSFPELGRYGLGHSLSAWARCVVWTHHHGARMLAPQWFKLRVGPYLRRERDKRNYFLLFHSPGCVTGLHRLWVLATRPRVVAEVDVADLAAPPAGTIMVFRNALKDNEKKHFHEFRDEHALLRREILKITRPRYIPAPFPEPTVAVHIRMGDFTKVAEGDAAGMARNNSRIQLAWYIETLEKVRRTLGRDIPAVIVSDGEADELAPILGLPNVRRGPKQPSITDMLSISHADLLIASGSGFSVWGRFFGQVPTICFPGQRVVNAVTTAPEVECAGADPLPADLVDVLKRRFLGSPADRHVEA